MKNSIQYIIAFIIGVLFTTVVVYVGLKYGFDGAVGHETERVYEAPIAEPDAYSEAENESEHEYIGDSLSLLQIMMYDALGANPMGYRDAYGNYLVFSNDGHYLFQFKRMTEGGELRYINYYDVGVLESVIQTEILTFPSMGVLYMEWPEQVQDNGTTWYLFELTEEFYDDVEEAL